MFELHQEWTEKSWTTEANLWKRLLVDLDDVLDTWDAWILRISIDCEAVAHAWDTKMPWDATKAECSEKLVAIVRLDDLSDIENCALILVLRSHKVKRRGARWVAIRLSVVNGNCEANLPTGAKVLDKRWSHLNFEIIENDSTVSTCIESGLTLLKISERCNSRLDLSIGLDVDQGEFDASVPITITELSELERLKRHRCLSCVEGARNLTNCDESIVLAWNLLHDVTPIHDALLTHAGATTTHVVNILPA